jgi:hypothetical protein
VCAFPNHVQSFEFTTGGLQSSCGNISRIINRNRMHLSSMFSILIAKDLNTYVNKVFLFLIFNTFSEIKITVFALSFWGIVCRLMSGKKIFNQF